MSPQWAEEVLAQLRELNYKSPDSDSQPCRGGNRDALYLLVCYPVSTIHSPISNQSTLNMQTNKLTHNWTHSSLHKQYRNYTVWDSSLF